MASKASMLKQGANKTGKGLFAGMTKLETREEAPLNEVEVTSDIDKMTEEVNEPEPEIVKPVEVKEPEVVKTVEPVKKAPVEAVKVVKEVKKEEEEEINTSINNSVEEPKTQKEKANSRYEKEKFLLLDVRGYRDYVEHMAKAANMSATKYIRNLIQLDMDKNMDIYEAHKALEEKLRGRTGN
jgi:ABC-type antimicrobial peptide transport system permease subunit